MVNPNEKILTWHPEGRRGVQMPQRDYDIVCDFILSVLKTRDITITDLIELAEAELAGSIQNDISWYVLTVKLDLEARELLTTIQKPAPFRSQFLKLRPRALKKYNSISRATSLPA